MDNAVALSALGVLATCITLMTWVVKKVMGDVAPALQRHADTNLELKAAVQENTKVTVETKEFLVNLNGSLKRVVKHKQKAAKEEI